jgi:ABC-2 type transport system permease protein
VSAVPVQAAAPRLAGSVLLEEGAKLTAFLRRDLLIAWSYRVAFFTEWAGIAVQTVLFYFVGQMVDPAKLPTFGGAHTTYLEFAAIGIAVTAFVQLALGRVASGIRNEQMAGTLESLLMTPTATATIQLGSIFYDLVYIPIRTALFLAVVAVAFGLHFEAGGVMPATLTLLVFIPFVWGLGVVSGAIVLTFRKGSGITGLAVTGLTILSGTFFPLSVLPHWLESVASYSPIAVALDGMRESLLGGAGWSNFGSDVLVLAPVSVVSLVLGSAAFRWALRRERRRGSLGLY